MRGTAEYFNSLDANLRKQTELESLRAQIRDASTVELKDREDNERLKKQVSRESMLPLRRHVTSIVSWQRNERYPAAASATSRRNGASGTTSLRGCRIRCARSTLLGGKMSQSCSRSSCRKRSCQMNVPARKSAML